MSDTIATLTKIEQDLRRDSRRQMYLEAAQAKRDRRRARNQRNWQNERLQVARSHKEITQVLKVREEPFECTGCRDRIFYSLGEQYFLDQHTDGRYLGVYCTACQSI